MTPKFITKVSLIVFCKRSTSSSAIWCPRYNQCMDLQLPSWQAPSGGGGWISILLCQRQIRSPSGLSARALLVPSTHKRPAWEADRTSKTICGWHSSIQDDLQRPWSGPATTRPPPSSWLGPPIAGTWSFILPNASLSRSPGAGTLYATPMNCMATFLIPSSQPSTSGSPSTESSTGTSI